MNTNYTYEVALSFAGEDREYVKQVAEFLKLNNVSVFYDSYETVKTWGTNLQEYFMEVYFEKAKYTIMFISKYYAEKKWTIYERRCALARALDEKKEYILPARFDDTEIPGLLKTIGFIDLRVLTPEDFGILILEKIERVHITANLDIENNIFPQIDQTSKVDFEEEVKVLEQLIDFAYSSSRMDMPKHVAKDWALRVLEEKSHDEIPQFINNLNLLIEVAYSSSSSGMDMSKSSSRDWALNTIAKLDKDIVPQFVSDLKKLINSAYSSSKMNMSRSDSRDWALAKIKEKYIL